MSEFKFACPVCGQHITADSSSSGTHLDCPTCFQKIVVPQAPIADSKLILSASRPSQKRSHAYTDSSLDPLRRRHKTLSLGSAAVMLVLLAVAAGAYWFGPKLVDLAKGGNKPPQPILADEETADPGKVRWTLNPAKAKIPNRPATGSIHGRSFSCDHASLTGGALLLRQGSVWPPELALALVLPARSSEALSGKNIQLEPAALTNFPPVMLRWKDEQSKTQRQDFTNGYVLKLAFGSPVAGHMSGSIFIALPDEKRSVVAGTFNAEIRTVRGPK